MMTTRRAAMDGELRDKLRQRVLELLEEKDNGPSDGEVYLFDEPVSREARLASRIVATDFPTEEALEKYLKDHPDSNRSLHKVVKEQKGPAKKDDKGEKRKPGEDDEGGKKGPAEKDDGEKKGPAEKDKAPGEDKKLEEKPGDKKPEDKKLEEKPGDKKPEEKPGDKKPGSKGPKRELFLGPDTPHHPSKAPEGEHRSMAIKDALIQEFGEDAAKWRTHKVHETQLTKNVMVRFPDGSRKRYGELSDEEKGRVKQAISEGMAASKGMNDYTRPDVATMHRNMENNLAASDDGKTEETKNETDEPVSKENAEETSSRARENCRTLVRKYAKATSKVSRPIADGAVDDYADALHEALTDGSLEGVSQKDVDEFMREDVKRMLHQEVETKRRSLGDHGIRHVGGNIRSTTNILKELEGRGVKPTGKQKLMAIAIQMNHDAGYTVGDVATDISKGKGHVAQSKAMAEEERARYEKVFGKEDAQKIIDVIGSHDSNQIDWEADPVGSAVRLADNTSLFGNDKVQDLFIRNPKTIALACKLRLAARSEPPKPSKPDREKFKTDEDFGKAQKDYEAKKAEYDKPETQEKVKKAKKLQEGIKEQMHDAIDGGGFGEDADELHKQVDEMSEGKFSTTADILSRYSGKLKGFKYDPKRKIMDVAMEYSPEGEMVGALFGDQLAAQQFDKFAKDGKVEPMRGRHGRMTFKNDKGQRAFTLNIDKFDDDPIDAASTGAMRDFYTKTARGDLRKASALLKRKGAGEKETARARKVMEGARDKFTDKEWEEVDKALEEGKDLGELAKKLDAWPLLEAEMSFLTSKQASLARMAQAVFLAEMADRVAGAALAGEKVMYDVYVSKAYFPRESWTKTPGHDAMYSWRVRGPAGKRSEVAAKVWADHGARLLMEEMTPGTKRVSLNVSGGTGMGTVEAASRLSPVQVHPFLKASSRAMTASGHPLDETQQGPWGTYPQQNYWRQVCNSLYNVIESDEKISEKDFPRVEAAMARAEAAVRDEANAGDVADAEARGLRPDLCAELLHAKMSGKARGRAAARGMQLVRKDKDTMSDTGGTSKSRRRDPDKGAPRDDCRKPWREKNRTEEERDRDQSGDKDPDAKREAATAEFAAAARRELSRWPARFAEAVGRLA